MNKRDKLILVRKYLKKLIQAFQDYKWTKDFWFRNRKGKKVNYSTGQVSQVCLGGACDIVAIENPEFEPVFRWTRQALAKAIYDTIPDVRVLPGGCFSDVYVWNDDICTGKKDVLRIIRKALTRTKQRLERI